MLCTVPVATRAGNKNPAIQENRARFICSSPRVEVNVVIREQIRSSVT